MKRRTDVLSQEKRKRKGLDLKRKIGFICEMLTTDIECVSCWSFMFLLSLDRADWSGILENWLALSIDVFSLVLLYLLKINICDIARTLMCAKTSIFILMDFSFSLFYLFYPIVNLRIFTYICQPFLTTILTRMYVHVYYFYSICFILHSTLRISLGIPAKTRYSN